MHHLLISDSRPGTYKIERVRRDLGRRKYSLALSESPQGTTFRGMEKTLFEVSHRRVRTKSTGLGVGGGV